MLSPDTDLDQLVDHLIRALEHAEAINHHMLVHIIKMGLLEAALAGSRGKTH